MPAMQLQTDVTLFAFAILLALQCRCVNTACSGTCYSLEPRPAPPSNSELDTLHSIRCQLGCIEQLGGSLQLNTDYVVWPTLSLSELEGNCILYQKVQGCMLGCATGFENQSLSINQCRDECYTNCRERVCEGQTSCQQPGTSCERKCRKTYCRFGCQQHTSLNTIDNNGQSLYSPQSAPNLTSVQSTSNPGHFHIDVRQSMPAVNSTQQQLPVVNYLFKVEATQLDRVSYYWKNELRTPLDLSAFSCQQISVSFAVVSKYNISQYSPRSQICVPGLSGHPSQVDRNSIVVHYTEDNREGYFGYSIANISWQRPSRHQLISSYTIRILTKTSGCGGINYLYSYTNINKDATFFMLNAQRQNGVLKFGCSYTLTILTLPAQPSEVGTTKRIAPEMPGPPPQIVFECSKVWDKHGNFNISAGWTLPNSTQLLETIRHFVVNPILKDTRLFGAFGIIRRYNTHTVPTEDDKMKYSLMLAPFRPQHIRTYKYEVELRTEKKAEYFWRNVPRMQSCIIDSESLSPVPMSNITASELQVDELGQLIFRLTWSAPTITNGRITVYEVRIGSGPIHEAETVPTERGGDGQVYMKRFPAAVNSAFINVTVDLNESVHCLYLSMRSQNEFLPSNWSEPLTLPLDDGCDGFRPNATDSSNNVLLYLENGGTTIKLLELECSGNPHRSSEDTLKKTLQKLEEKLDAMTNNYMQVSSLENRLTSIQQKLDNITDLWSSHLHG